MSRVSGRTTSEGLGKIKSRITRIRERRGLNHPPFGEIHFGKDKESQTTSWCLSRMGKGEGSLLSVGDVEEITSKGSSLSKAKAP